MTIVVKLFVLKGASKLDENGLVKVTPELLVEGLEHVYAIGDCCNTDQEKMAAHAQNQGESVCRNIALALAGSEKRPYKPSESTTYKSSACGDHR